MLTFNTKIVDRLNSTPGGESYLFAQLVQLKAFTHLHVFPVFLFSQPSAQKHKQVLVMSPCVCANWAGYQGHTSYLCYIEERHVLWLSCKHTVLDKNVTFIECTLMLIISLMSVLRQWINTGSISSCDFLIFFPTIFFVEISCQSEPCDQPYEAQHRVFPFKAWLDLFILHSDEDNKQGGVKLIDENLVGSSISTLSSFACVEHRNLLCDQTESDMDQMLIGPLWLKCSAIWHTSSQSDLVNFQCVSNRRTQVWTKRFLLWHLVMRSHVFRANPPSRL